MYGIRAQMLKEEICRNHREVLRFRQLVLGLGFVAKSSERQQFSRMEWKFRGKKGDGGWIKREAAKELSLVLIQSLGDKGHLAKGYRLIFLSLLWRISF